MSVRGLLALGFVFAAIGSAWAQPPEEPPDPDVVSIRINFEVGKYEDALRRSRERIDRGGLAEPQLLELHKIAGLSAFALGQQSDAERHFGAVLRLDPDFALDPFVVPPPAIQLFEKIRKDMGPTLDGIRYEKRLKAERERKEAEELLKKKKLEEEERRKLELMAAMAAARTIEKRSFLVNFVPFGAGQFQQGRPGMGVALAVSEGMFALTSIFGYWAYNGLITEQPYTLDDYEGKPGIKEVGIPPDRVSEAAVYRWMQLGAGAAFYVVYIFGVVDAIYHHESEVLIEPAEPPKLTPKTSFHLMPVSGGAAAGLTVKF